jgi:hypothetical protein
MTQAAPPSHRLSLIGYWSEPAAPADRSRGWPDPQELTGERSPDDRGAVVAYLRRGTVFRHFSGRAECRICGDALGTQELTDGVWAWPDGLDHYVERHGVRLPEDFVAAARAPETDTPAWLASLEPEHWVQSGPDAAVPVLFTKQTACIVDDSTWLDWVAANTPAHPAADAASLEEARAVCRRLSHAAWSAGIEEVNGRWCVRMHAGGHEARIYLQKCAAPAIERRLLSLRKPDGSCILDLQRANAIAAEYDGPWGAARAVATHPQALLVWVKAPNAKWPTEAEIQKVLKMPLSFGWVIAHPGGGKSFVVPPMDEVGWRWLLTCERSDAAK